MESPFSVVVFMLGLAPLLPSSRLSTLSAQASEGETNLDSKSTIHASKPLWMASNCPQNNPSRILLLFFQVFSCRTRLVDWLYGKQSQDFYIVDEKSVEISPVSQALKPPLRNQQYSTMVLSEMLYSNDLWRTNDRHRCTGHLSLTTLMHSSSKQNLGHSSLLTDCNTRTTACHKNELILLLISWMSFITWSASVPSRVSIYRSLILGGWHSLLVLQCQGSTDIKEWWIFFYSISCTAIVIFVVRLSLSLLDCLVNASKPGLWTFFLSKNEPFYCIFLQ